MNKFWNYYEIDSFCKSEGINTDYFIYEINRINKKNSKNILLSLISIFTKYSKIILKTFSKITLFKNKIYEIIDILGAARATKK